MTTTQNDKAREEFERAVKIIEPRIPLEWSEDDGRYNSIDTHRRYALWQAALATKPAAPSGGAPWDLDDCPKCGHMYEQGMLDAKVPIVDAPKVVDGLLPCPNPWCEALDRLGDFTPSIRLHHFGNYFVVCPSCILEGPLRGSKDEALKAWNTRANPSPVAEDADSMGPDAIDSNALESKTGTLATPSGPTPFTQGKEEK